MKKAILVLSLVLMASMAMAQTTAIYDIQNGSATGTVTVQGIVMATDNYHHTWVADAQGAWNGILVFNETVSTSYVVGDEVSITGEVNEYYNMTQIYNVTAHSQISTGNTPYAPIIVTCADLDDDIGADTAPAEQYEGCLVQIQNAICVTEQETTYYEATVSDDGETNVTIIDDDANYQMGFGMTAGNYYNITGVVTFGYGQYKVNPRDATDIEPGSSVSNWELY